MSFCITIPALQFGTSLNEIYNKNHDKEMMNKENHDNCKKIKAKLEVKPKKEPIKQNISSNKKNNPKVINKEKPVKKNLCDKKVLPFKLPTLSKEQRQILKSGRVVEEISNKRRRSSTKGLDYVVVDIDAPASVIWQYLLDFKSYPSFIAKVKNAKVLNRKRENDHKITINTEFFITRHKIKAHIIHKYNIDGDYMTFSLDSKKSASTIPGIQSAKGIWHTQQITPFKTRTWMLCNIQGSIFLPSWMIQSTTQRFMPMAASWVKPNAELKYSQLLQSTSTSSSFTANNNKKQHIRIGSRKYTQTTTQFHRDNMQ